MRDDHTPGRLAPHDPSTWKNSALSHYVVQAHSRDAVFAAHDGVDQPVSAPIRRCDRGGDPCPGLSADRRSGVILQRADALHAIHRHYEYPNLGLFRFASTAKGLYAVDLSIDIDAHADLPALTPSWDPRAFYVPLIAAAAEVGAVLVEYLRDELKLDPRYLTTSVGRMGARVTVDWRAFGPRRAWLVATVIRYIEAQVFGSEGLARIAARHGVPSVEIDAGIYLRSDLARIGADGENALLGPTLRPLLALHPKSSNAALWARPTPVSHDRLRPEHAEWLVGVSRGTRPNFRPATDIDPTLVPEMRFARADAIIESSPNPCERLIELVERTDLLDLVLPEHREALDRQRLLAGGVQRREVQAGRDYTPEVVERVLEALDLKPKRADDELWQIICPRCGVDRSGAPRRDGTAFTTGWVKCFQTDCSLHHGAPLHVIANEHGLGHLIPPRAVSSTPLVRMPINEVPKSTAGEWGPNVKVISPKCSTVEEIDAERRKVYEPALADPTVRVILDRSPTGTGKTTTVQTLLAERGDRYRVLVPRDEHKESWVKTVPRTLPIVGRRPEENCDHPDLAEVQSRRESVEKALCSTCPRKPRPDNKPKDPCAYWMQFENAADHNLALSHQHGMHEVERIRNGSTIDVIDEDPLSAVVSDANVDIDLRELDLFAVVAERVHAGEGEDGEPVLVVDLDTPSEWRRKASSETMATVIRRLRDVLSGDPITDKFPHIAKTGHIADLPLARVLFGDRDFADAVGRLDDAEIDTYQAAREALREATRRTEYMGVYLPSHVAAQWVAPGGDPIEDVLAGHAWDQPHLVPLPSAPMDRETKEALRRPVDVMRTLRDALSSMLRAHERGYGGTSSLQAYREARASTWTLRVTKSKPILDPREPTRPTTDEAPEPQQPPAKLVVLSATMTAERAKLALGAPSSAARWIVFEPQLTRREERIVIADKIYGKATFKKKGSEQLRAEVYEAIDRIIATETERTGLPVAVVGPGETVTAYTEHRLGRALPKELKMPLRGAKDRAARLEKLHAMTRPLGFLPGYAFGVSGSNVFVGEGGKFVRALVMVGAPIPNLGAVARDHRGLYAHDLTEWDVIDSLIGVPVAGPDPVDWTQTWRTVAFEGTEQADGTVLAARNVPGYVDERANAILHGMMQGEIVQILGRLRSMIGDELARAYLFSGIAIEGMEVDRVVTLDGLREGLGLRVEPKAKRGPAPKMRLGDALVAAVKKFGRRKAVGSLARALAKQGERDMVETRVRLAFEAAGLGWTQSDREAVRGALG